MRRFIVLSVIVGFLFSVGLVYRLKYETRALALKLQELERQIQQEKDAVAELRSEWRFLTRAERLARLAQTHLGMSPLAPSQMVYSENQLLPLLAQMREGEREPTSGHAR